MAAQNSTRRRVHLYLDIDGVLNAYERRSITIPSLWDGGYTTVRWESWSPAMVAELNRIITEHGIVCHWLTTWESEAGAFGKLIGLDGSESWPWLPARSGGLDDWQKFDSIRDHIAKTEPDLAFWFDDDLATEPDADEWASSHPRVYHFAPNGTHGITPSMLGDMEAILRG